MVYLKSIDAYGFKSFADHTDVQFDNGVTAIVGPNGSGKSNITDAIKWVLGEQSAKSLRGSKMEDIIFSGAEHRKAQNYAEVQLKLDNSSGKLQYDAELVTVTRRLYRSGESEYYLNNERARLKDIVDLFLDSGLGKEAFSIISQGRVDEILNAKPIDRRQIIEESAGVLKYKKRKASSVQKLDQTEDNLTRVEDILYDLEGRVEPLREEASIAKEYQHLAAEMEKSDILVTVHDIETYNDNVHELDEQLNSLKSQQETKEANKVQHTKALNKYKSERQQYDNEIEKLNYQLVKATEDLEKYNGQLNVLKERQKNQSETNARFEEEQENLEEQKERLQQELAQAKEEITTLQQQQKELNQQIQSYENQLGHSDDDTEAQLEDLKDQYYALMSEQSDVNNDIRFLEHTIQENESKQSRLDSRLGEAYEALQKVQQEIVTTEQSHAQADKELKAIEQELNQREQELTRVKKKQSEYEHQLHQAYRYNEKLKSRIDSMSAQQEGYNYFFNGVKHVLKAKDTQLSGIHGAVAEIIDVPSELTKAIEIALGASMQHVIVETEQAGRQAIQYLKQHSLGRATFLPLNVIKPRQLSAEIQSIAERAEGFINIASEAISVDPQYQHIVRNLLGNTIIVNDLKQANELARAIRYRTRIVTLEGDIVNPGGSMSGGGERKTKSVLAQKDELAKMKAQLESYHRQTVDFEQQFQEMNDQANQLSEDYLSSSQRYNEIKQHKHELSLELDRLRTNEAQIKDDHEEFQFEKNDGYESAKSKATLNEKQQQLSEIKERLAQLEKDIERLTELNKEGKASTTQLQQQLNQKKSDLAVTKERLKTQRQMKERLNEQLDQTDQALEQLLEKIEFFNSDEITGQQAFDQIQSQIDEKQEDKSRFNQQLEELKAQRSELNETIEETDALLQETHRDILSIENRYQDIKAEQSRLDVLISHAIDHLSVKTIM